MIDSFVSQNRHRFRRRDASGFGVWESLLGVFHYMCVHPVNLLDEEAIQAFRLEPMKTGVHNEVFSLEDSVASKVGLEI